MYKTKHQSKKEIEEKIAELTEEYETNFQLNIVGIILSFAYAIKFGVSVLLICMVPTLVVLYYKNH